MALVNLQTLRPVPTRSSLKINASLSAGFKHSLLLSRGSSCRNAALGKLCLDLDFLIGYKTDFGFERLVSSQANRDLPSPGGDQQRSADTTEFSHVSGKDASTKTAALSGVTDNLTSAVTVGNWTRRSFSNATRTTCLTPG
jgi:hypothetical protein